MWCVEKIVINTSFSNGTVRALLPHIVMALARTPVCLVRCWWSSSAGWSFAYRRTRLLLDLGLGFFYFCMSLFGRFGFRSRSTLKILETALELFACYVVSSLVFCFSLKSQWTHGSYVERFGFEFAAFLPNPKFWSSLRWDWRFHWMRCWCHDVVERWALQQSYSWARHWYCLQ